MNKPAAKPAARTRRPATPKAPAAAPAPAPQFTFAQQLLQAAIARGSTAEEIDRLIAMVDRADVLERQKAHTAAMVDLARDLEHVQLTKDKRNDDFGNSYISIGKLVQTMAPLLAKHGLAASWDIDQSKGSEITVTAILAHQLGHSTRAAITVPRDIDDRKNDLQAIKSSLTYARSMTYEAVCGLAATEASVDNDGNGAGRKQDDGPVSELLAQARAEAAQGPAAFQKFWKYASPEQRRELSPQLKDLEARAAAAGKKGGK